MVRALLACLVTAVMTFLVSQTQAQDQELVAWWRFDDVLTGQVFVSDGDEEDEEDYDELADEDDEDDDDDEEEGEDEEEDVEDDEDEAFGDDEHADGLVYDGEESVLIAKSQDFDMTDADYTIVARIRTEESGSIFSQAPRTGGWSENGKALFIAEGRLAFDIGWVGFVMSQREVADGDWHDVAMTFDHVAGKVRLFIDGNFDVEEELAPDAPVEGHVVRIGFTSPDFPDEGRGFQGQISRVAFYQRALSAKEMPELTQVKLPAEGLVADWREFDHDADTLIDASGKGHDGSLEDVEIWEGEEDDEEEDEQDDEEDEDAVEETERISVRAFFVRDEMNWWRSSPLHWGAPNPRVWRRLLQNASHTH